MKSEQEIREKIEQLAANVEEIESESDMSAVNTRNQKAALEWVLDE